MVNLNGWDTVSVVDVAQVNGQLATRLSELVMTFDATWVDGFAGTYTATGTFGAWSITGGSGSDVYLRLPIASGSATPQGGGAAVDLAGMAVTLEVNLEWIPSTVTQQGRDLRFALHEVTADGAPRAPGGISVHAWEDPHTTGYGRELGTALAAVLVDQKDKITFVFAQTGVVSTSTATWLEPRKSVYSVHQPTGGGRQYLAILSVVTDRDISGLSSNVDSGLLSDRYPLSFAVSGELFLANVILPSLPAAFPGTSASAFAYSGGAITATGTFDLAAVKVGAIWYTPVVSSMRITVDTNTLRNATSGSVYLDLPNAYLDFSATTRNPLSYDAGNQTFAFGTDPNPVTSTSDHVPWYDYVLTLGVIGAAITAAVLAAVESGLSNSLGGSNLAGSLAGAPGTSVHWPGLEHVTAGAASLNDAFLMLADVR